MSTWICAIERRPRTSSSRNSPSSIGGRDFSEVRLTINGAELHGVTLSPPLELRATERTELFSEVDVFKDWLLHGSSDYLGDARRRW